MLPRRLRQSLSALLAGILLFMAHCPAGATTRMVQTDLQPLETGTAQSTADTGTAPKEQVRKQIAKWRLLADSMASLNQDDIVEASGDVVLQTGETTLQADFARLFTKTKWVYLKGNVSITSGNDTLSAEEAEFDLNNKTGRMQKGNLFLADPHIYVSGEHIIKHDGDRYSFTDARFTTCDGPNPDWTLLARSGRLEIDGYAHLFGASMAVKSVSAIPIPYILLPLKTTRQSGLLLPDVGYSSSRGTTYTQPFYWAINDTSDLTFYTTFMSHVGGGVTAEYRSIPDKDTRTWAALTYINDRRTDKHSPPRADDHRFWLRGMFDGKLGDSDWRYKADIDYVSDRYFLDDFNTGQIGYNKSRQDLHALFHRTLQETNAGKNRRSQGMLYRNWDRIGLAASMRYEQNPGYRHANVHSNTDTTAQVLPQFDAFLYKGAVIDQLPLDIEARLTSAYLYRRDGNNALRTMFTPSVSAPLDLGYASVIPTFTLHQTWYTNSTCRHDERHLSKRKQTWLPSAARTDSRYDGKDSTVPEFETRISTEASRIWQFDNEPADDTEQGWNPFDGWVGLKHTIQPELKYHYLRKEIDQRENPYFDDDDRILPANELTYSITNILTRKKVVRPAASPKDSLPSEQVAWTDSEFSGDSEPIVSYMDILRWKLEWGYDFNERDRVNLVHKYERRPLMDIMSEISLHPFTWMSLSSRTYFSPYTGKLTRQDFTSSLSFQDYLKWTCSIDYRTEDYNLRQVLRHTLWNSTTIGTKSSNTHILKNWITINLPPHWYLSAYDYRNLRRPHKSGWRGKGYEKGIILGYRSQCWNIYLQMSDDGKDKSYSVNFEVPGLFTTGK